MQEGIVEVLALIDGHAAILPRLPVEDGIDGHERAAKDGAADEQLAQARPGKGATRLLLGLRLLQVRPGAAEPGKGISRDGGARCEEEAARARSLRDLRLLMEGSHGNRGLERGLGQLREAVRQARGPLADGECEGHCGAKFSCC